jgi:hypothetical protein
MEAVTGVQTCALPISQMDARQADLELGVQSDPLVQAVLNRFPGAKVVGVTQNAPAAEAGDAVPDADMEPEE